MKYSLIVGQTAPLDFGLFDDDAPAVLTNLAVPELILHDSDDRPVDATNACVWIDSSVGTVRVTPPVALPAGTYTARFKLVDGNGDVAFYPDSGKPDIWVVSPQ